MGLKDTSTLVAPVPRGIIDPNTATASNMVGLLARVILWALGILFVLSNLGIEVTSLLAGLGIGGIAIAFALQGILSDLFSSFSLYFDKPFRIGDYVVIGQHSGTVEKIGIKTTRIRTLQGEELVVSNNELTTTRVQNFKKMQERTQHNIAHSEFLLIRYKLVCGKSGIKIEFIKKDSDNRTS